MNEKEKLHNELEEIYEKIVEMLSNGNFLQLNGKAINLTELNEYINAQQEEIERLNNILDTLMQDMALLNATSKKEIKPKYVFDRIATLRGVDKE